MVDKSKVLVLTKEDIESVVTIDDAIAAVEEGFKAFNSDKAIVPFPVALNVPDGHGDIHIKPGYMNSMLAREKVATGIPLWVYRISGS